MKAVVMAGGEGSRLRPITLNRPKPLVPICNKPIMEHILGLLKRHGITEVVSTLYYLGDEIKDYFGDGEDFGVKMEYSVETVPLGTAGSVKKAEALLKDETFLIISGDALTDCDLTKAIQFHKAKGSIATLILYRVASPLEFGVVITDPDGKVVRFLEKPSWSEVFSDTVNTGMYILEPEIFDTMEPGKNYDWSSDIFPLLLEEGKPMYGYVMGDYWADVGSLSQYREAQEHLLSGQLNVEFGGQGQDSGLMIGPNCVISPTATLVPPVCIGRSCKIKAGARVGPYTVIGDNSLIEEEANVERSVIWDSAYIGPNVSVRSAIICSRTTIKKDSNIREDAVIGDRCMLDTNCTVRPRVKIWPDKIVERGSTITMSLIWGSKWRGSLFRELGVTGLSNIEITPDFACRLGAAFGSCFSTPCRIVTSRDSSKSSRMIKRALISSLLSVGCDVLDLRSSALPVARHFIKASGAAGALSVRKLPGNPRVTLIEMFDARGAYLSRSLERKVENAFFREDFKRTDSEDLGIIDFPGRAVEEYQNDFQRLLDMSEGRHRLRIVCDYGYSNVSGFYPAMLVNLGVEFISINAYNDARRAPRTKDHMDGHIQNLSQIVGTLGYDMGVLFTQEGERMTIVDNRGRAFSGLDLLAAMGMLVAQTTPDCKIALSVTAPSLLQEALEARGATVLRTKSDTHSLMSTSFEAGATFAGDDDGGFIFPELHPGFDATFAFAKLITMLQKTRHTLSDLADELPKFQVAYERVRVSWENKGSIMRLLSEDVEKTRRVDLLDGIKIFGNDDWVLVLPDANEPVVHIFAEAQTPEQTRSLVGQYEEKILAWSANG
jgi:mannose-1-phosphate guanylyltransferase/phosphomannomutase